MSIDKGQILLPIARSTIAKQLGQTVQPGSAAVDAPWLQELGATFITLTQDGELRGCIGTLEAHRPLIEDVKSNALAAAFSDPRFTPLQHSELSYTRVEYPCCHRANLSLRIGATRIGAIAARDRRHHFRIRPISQHFPATGMGTVTRRANSWRT